MRFNTIIKILNRHSIPYYVQNGRVYADTMESSTELFESVEDVTDLTRSQLYEWLGY